MCAGKRVARRNRTKELLLLLPLLPASAIGSKAEASIPLSLSFTHSPLTVAAALSLFF